MSRAFPALCLAAVLAAASAGAAQMAPARVLFIGNSLTYANDLPGMVEDVSGGAVTAVMVAFPDYSLDDHWRRGDALRAIRRGGWTHVVLQQGPSSLPESRRLLVRDATRFAREIRKAGAEVVLYGVWPAADRRPYFRAVSESYAAAAKAGGGTLVAVGDGWRAAWDADPSLPLYGPDGFHPSPLGTYLGALMIARHVTGAVPPGEPAAVPGATSAQVQTARAAALRSY